MRCFLWFGHKWTEWKATRVYHFRQDDYETRRCLRCGERDYRSLPMPKGDQEQAKGGE